MANNIVNKLIEVAFSSIDDYISTGDECSLIFGLLKFDRALHVSVGDYYNNWKGSEVLKGLDLNRKMWEYRILDFTIVLRGNIVHLKTAKTRSISTVLSTSLAKVCLESIKVWARSISSELNFIKCSDGSQISHVYNLVFIRSENNIVLTTTNGVNSIVIWRKKN